MRAVITGGAGFIGTRLAGRLAAQGHSVRILDIAPGAPQGRNSGAAIPGVEHVFADVRQQHTVIAAMDGVDVVHHLAADTGVGQSQYEFVRYVETNTFGTAVVLQAALAAHAKQLVIASSRAVYGEGQWRCRSCDTSFTAEQRRVTDLDRGVWDVPCPSCAALAEYQPTPESAPPAPSSVYGLTKLQQEQLGRMVSRVHHLPVTILRLFNVYGPGQSLSNPYVGVLGTFFRRIRSGGPVELYEDGQMLRDFVFVDDAVAVLSAVTAREDCFGCTLNVGTGLGITLLEVAQGLSAEMGAAPHIEVRGRYRVGDVRHAVADISSLESRTGYRPRTPFAEGLQAFVGWAQENAVDADDLGAQRQLESRNLFRQAKFPNGGIGEIEP